jgi:histidyl-tRNA synthetase
MQPVWRADRPQRGRYREFWQCDADIAGNTLLHETELVLIYTHAFQQLGIPVNIHINNRKILSGLAALCGGEDMMMDITIAIDKLDKIGIEKVQDELVSKGLSIEQVESVASFIAINGSNEDILQQLNELFHTIPVGLEGVAELRDVIDLFNAAKPKTSDIPELKIDLSLARGLNYYTGSIFEVKSSTVRMGSIGGGGRYDDLTGLFGVKGVGGVGISFGVDRIYDVMEELNIFPESLQQGTDVLLFNTGTDELKQVLLLAESLRAAGTSAEIFHEPAKFDKQFKYAERKKIAFVVILGSKEIENGTVVVKHLSSGKQLELSQSDLQNDWKSLFNEQIS